MHSSLKQILQISCVTFINLILAVPSYACTVGFLSYEEAKMESNLVLVGTVQFPAKQDSDLSTSFVYPFTLVRIESENKSLEVKKIVWEQFKVRHKKNGDIQCPLWWGSGIENSLEPGKVYKFLLRGSENRNQPPQLLWAEPVKSGE